MSEYPSAYAARPDTSTTAEPSASDVQRNITVIVPRSAKDQLTCYARALKELVESAEQEYSRDHAKKVARARVNVVIPKEKSDLLDALRTPAGLVIFTGHGAIGGEVPLVHTDDPDLIGIVTAPGLLVSTCYSSSAASNIHRWLALPEAALIVCYKTIGFFESTLFDATFVMHVLCASARKPLTAHEITAAFEQTKHAVRGMLEGNSLSLGRRFLYSRSDTS